MVAGGHDDLPVRFLAQLSIVFIPQWVEGGSPLTASSTGFPRLSEEHCMERRKRETKQRERQRGMMEKSVEVERGVSLPSSLKK